MIRRTSSNGVAIAAAEHYSCVMGSNKATHATVRSSITRFEQIINVGKATADDFRLLGHDSPQQLIGKDPAKLFTRLCALTHSRQDPCVLDVFMATVDFMNGNPPRPWWDYTEERKAKYQHLYS